MASIQTWGTRAALAVAALALTACGSGGGVNAGPSPTPSPSPTVTATSATPSPSASGSDEATQLIDKAREALQSTKSLRVKGTINDPDMGDISLDVVLVRGVGGAGTIGVKGATIQTAYVGGTFYMKADAASWTKLSDDSDANVSSLLADKWWIIPATSKFSADTAEFKAFTDLDGTWSTILDGATGLAESGTATINGETTVKLADVPDDGAYLYVGRDSGHLVRFGSVATATDPAGQINFLDYGKATTISAPPGAKALPAAAN